jgi:hypothetical protein
MKLFRLHSRPVAGVFLLYFLTFIFLIQLPVFHNLGADLNYSNIHEYGLAEENHCFPAPGEQHLHHFLHLPQLFCFVCNLVSSPSENTPAENTEYWDDVDLYIPVFMAEIYTEPSYHLPLLRAPPLS